VVGTILALVLLAAAPGARPLDFVHSCTPADSLIRPGETHFAHLWQVTSQGGNAYPRWSRDGKRMVFETTFASCPRAIDLLSTPRGLLTTVGGVGDDATSPSFVGGGVVYSYWKVVADSCRSSAERWREDRWYLSPASTLQIGGQAMERLTLAGMTGAIEPNASPDGKQIVFTATPANDPELYLANRDGTDVRRLTADYGYDGGACFSPDGQFICYQAYHPREETERAQYDDLLKRGLIDSSRLDIWVMHADGSGRGQVTDLEATSMEPSFTPDGKRIIFASDYQDTPGRQFDLYITKLDGGAPEKITNDPSPDCFPMFSPDGRYLAFTSGRGAASAGDQNVFIAQWKE
jgi:Tol biopolymer transport system component